MRSSGRDCTTPGCHSEQRTIGLCTACYMRARRTGVVSASADPTARRLREALAQLRRDGWDFPRAWSQALKELKPLPKGWGVRAGGVTGEHVSLYDFARRVFAQGYARMPVGADITHIASEDAHPGPPRDGTPREHTHYCGWGDGCGTVIEQRGLCPKHSALLADIKAELKRKRRADGRHADGVEDELLAFA